MSIPTRDLDKSAMRSLDNLADIWRSRQPAIAFTGAGISTESGIPDFRGPNGFWKTTKPTSFRQFLRDPELQIQHWERRRQRYPELLEKQPNRGHRALVALQEARLLGEIITQNIDGLHLRAGTQPNRLIELHGSAHEIRCLDCGRVYPANSADLDLEAELPVCPVCGGTIKESTIAFGEGLVEKDLRRSIDLAEASQLVLVVGSSLKVNPAAKVPLVAARAGAALAIVNNEPTPLDKRADFVIPASAGAALEYLANRIMSDS